MSQAEIEMTAITLIVAGSETSEYSPAIIKYLESLRITDH